MHRIAPTLSLLLALTTPLAAYAQPGDDDDRVAVEPGAVTVTRTEVAVVPVELVAPPPGRIEGRHRLHIESDAFAWRRWQPWTDDGADATRAGETTTDVLGILGGAPTFGLPGSGPGGNVTFGYGYGVTDRILVGARLGLGWQQFTTPDGDDQASRALAYNITPYFEFVMRPGYKVRPFVGARVGVGGSSFTDVSGDLTQRASTVGPLFGASVGLHGFVSERVSLDAALAFDYALAFSRTRISGGDMDQKTDFERAARMPNLALVVGLSVWLGRDRERTPRHGDRDSAHRR